MNHTKYRPYPAFVLPERQWPGNAIKKNPVWCSVDLRDGNQALEKPMTLTQKLDFFRFLVGLGFKQIEVGFPAASDTEYIFTRRLIEDNLIPSDVTIQVLTQAREHIIAKTFEALAGVNKAIVHLYNSTSTLQREVVFAKSRDEIKALAVEGAAYVKKLAEKYGRERFIFEYSPESFTGTEMDYALEVSNEVLDIWRPSEENTCIINLPSTVEMATPNVYADQIEYMCRHLNYREHILVSLHAHNDRGTAVAATELGLLAGADRVEGTLFGNGERTGNADIMNIALNLYTQGIEPGLDFSHVDAVIEMYEKSTEISVHPRHPYAGSLVFTAFSGSHQDAINKGMAKMKEHPDVWEVPYLPIDPADLGRSYDPIIRINSQSGKGGVAYVLEQSYGLQIPKAMQQEFSLLITRVSDEKNTELLPREIYDLFEGSYINIEKPLKLISYSEEALDTGAHVTASVLFAETELEIEGGGSGIMDAFCAALYRGIGEKIEITSYREHSLDYGSKSRAITYVRVVAADGNAYFGAGVSGNITKSSLRAVVSAVNKVMLNKNNS